MSATLRRPQGRGFTYLCLDEGETYLGDFIGAVTRLGGGEGGEQSERMRKGRVRLGTHNLFFEREAGGGGAGGASLVAAARAVALTLPTHRHVRSQTRRRKGRARAPRAPYG